MLYNCATAFAHFRLYVTDDPDNENLRPYILLYKENIVILQIYKGLSQKQTDNMKRQNYLLLLALMLLTMWQNVKAQTVSPDDAMAKAKAFVLNNSGVSAAKGTKGEAVSLSLAYTSKQGSETHYYVFNNAEGGYVIVGGDAVAKDVLAYSNSGTFDYNKIPSNMKWFLSCYDKEISHAIKMVNEGKASVNIISKAKGATPLNAPKENIDYLLKTKWDQVAPFNCMHPYNIENDLVEDDEYAIATGCVATAGAQIMKYHEWPETGVGSHTDLYTLNNRTFSANFGETTYQWDKMQNEYEYCWYNGDEADIAVGTLMYHIGVAVDMKFRQFMSGGSGADARTLAEALVTYFKYSKGITFHERTCYTDEQWEDMVYNELAEGRPVLYGGQQESGSSHSFVCDGYKDGLYHINWGWSGDCDNYFLLTPTADSGTALCPEGSGSGGGEAGEGYYMNQRIGIGITPDRDGTSQPVKSAFTSGYTVTTPSTFPGGSIKINGYYCGNESVVPQSYNVKMKFTNVDDESDVTIGTYTHTTNLIDFGFNEGSNKPFGVPTTLLPGQSYYVTLMYENNDGEYVDMPQPQNQEPQVISIVDEPAGIVLKELVLDNDGYITMNSFNFKVKIKNNTSTNWGTYYLKCPISFGGQDYDVYSEPVALNIGEEATATFDIYSQYGSYFSFFFNIGDKITTCIKDYDGNEISEPITFEFCNELPINYTLTDAAWGTLCLPYSAKVPEGMTAYTVTGTEVNKLVKEEAVTLEMNKPYLINGTPGTYSFVGPDTPKKENLVNGFLVGNTTTAQTYAPKASYVLQNLTDQDGLAFYEVENAGSQRVRQYGAYLKPLANDFASFRFIDDKPTDITIVESSKTNTRAYTIGGAATRINARGIVIVNGRLIFNK